MYKMYICLKIIYVFIMVQHVFGDAHVRIILYREFHNDIMI